MKASRLLALPPYLFEELEDRYRAAVAQGRDVIDLSVGDPDLSPPKSLFAHLEKALNKDRHHRYPPQRGSLELKAAIRRYLSRRCGFEPADNEILILVGSKEGLAHLPWAVCNPGDVALVPDPGYPVYRSAAEFAGCHVSAFPLDPANGFLPDMRDMQSGARICFLNYPNNPTSAVAGRGLFEDALSALAERGTILVNDAAYADVYFDGVRAPILCGVPGALELPVIEFFSFSKMYSITGWRVGFAVGNPAIIEALAHLKANIDSGAFGAIQEAVGGTLDGDGDEYTESMRNEYQKRRDVTARILARLGFHCYPTCATFYLWTQVPPPWKSMDYALHLLEAANVLVTPGTGFGAGGEGYFRIALTRPVARLQEAMERIAKLES